MKQPDIKFKALFKQEGNTGDIMRWETIGVNDRMDPLLQSSLRQVSPWLQYTGINDMEGNELLADDLIVNSRGETMRIYVSEGGFVIKGSIWAEDLSDLIPSDELVVHAIADTQIKHYIMQNCLRLGNYHENTPTVQEAKRISSASNRISHLENISQKNDHGQSQHEANS